MNLNTVNKKWLAVYDKYAAAMYGLIFKLIPNEKIAGELLEKAFAEIVSKDLTKDIENARCSVLLRLTYKSAITQLKQRNISPRYEEINSDAILTALCAAKFPDEGISLDESRRMLRNRVNNIRSNMESQTPVSETNVSMYFKFRNPLSY
ncbi:MAG: hypothetical protein ABI772_13285 [Bacteroidota bacterium]